MKSFKFSCLLLALLTLNLSISQAATEILGPAQVRPGITLQESLQKTEAPPASQNTSSDFMMQESSLSAVASEPLYFGVEERGEVSGIVQIRPNESQIPGIRKVAYYLNGVKSGKVYQSPFMWGGVTGNGTSGFDTRTIADGEYTLAMVYTDAAGDHEIPIRFTVNNTNPNPNPSGNPSAASLPATTAISPSGRTLGGETFPAGTAFSDVEQSGNLSFLADRNTLYVANSSNTANPELLSALAFETQILDIQAAPNGAGVFVLEKGPLLNGQFRSRLWFVNAANPSAPSFEQKADLRDGTRLSVKDGRLHSYYTSSGENFLVDCALSGSGTCAVGFYNLYMTPDLVHTSGSWIVSAAVNGSYLTLNHNDVTNTPTAAPVAFFSGKANYVYTSLKNGTVAVYDINQADTSAQGNGLLPVAATVNPDGNDPVLNFIYENKLAVLDSTGLIEVFDITNPLNITRLDSLTVAGAKGLDYDGTNLYVVTDREYRIVGPSAPTPGPTPSPNPSGSPVLGVTEGQTVSGVVNIRPDQTKIPGIKKVAYYLNGARSGKVYQTPYTWGGVSGDGTTGFDTRTLADGPYELAMVYTDATGDHTIVIHFNADN